MAGNLQFKIRMNTSYARISKTIHESVTQDTMYKVPSKWHHLWQEFRRRYKHNVYRLAAANKCDLFGAAARTGKLRQLEKLAEELFKKKEVEYAQAVTSET